MKKIQFNLIGNEGGNQMKSCWLIEFKDGHKVIISESLYKAENEMGFGGREVLVKEHWFDLETCRKRNRGVLVSGF